MSLLPFLSVFMELSTMKAALMVLYAYIVTQRIMCKADDLVKARQPPRRHRIAISNCDYFLLNLDV